MENITQDTKKAETDKDFWFVIEGCIYAKDKEDALNQLKQMAISGVNCERAFYNLRGRRHLNGGEIVV